MVSQKPEPQSLPPGTQLRLKGRCPGVVMIVSSRPAPEGIVPVYYYDANLLLREHQLRMSDIEAGVFVRVE